MKGMDEFGFDTVLNRKGKNSYKCDSVEVKIEKK